MRQNRYVGHFFGKRQPVFRNQRVVMADKVDAVVGYVQANMVWGDFQRIVVIVKISCNRQNSGLCCVSKRKFNGIGCAVFGGGWDLRQERRVAKQFKRAVSKG